MIKTIFILSFISLFSWQANSFVPDSIQEISTRKTHTAKNDKTFIFFWATWCTSCKTKLKRQEVPISKKLLIEVNKKYKKLICKKLSEQKLLAAPLQQRGFCPLENSLKIH